MKSKKIVLIGSGSQFSEFYLQEAFKYPEFKGTTIAFVDRKPERLKIVKGIADKINEELDFGINIEGYTDRRDALPGADLVYCFVAVDLKNSWNNDLQLCRKFGLNPFEFHTSSISSLSMGMRHIPIVLALCKDIEELCPDAWLVLDNNPLAKILSAVLRYTNTKCFGYCNGHELEQTGIEQMLSLDKQSKEIIESKTHEREFMVMGDNISVLFMGINHLGWVMTIRDSATGEDLYPKFREICKTTPLDQIPLGFRYSVELCNRLGYFPSPGDVHLADYIWNLDDDVIRRTGLEPFNPFDWFGGRDANAWEEIAARVTDKESAEAFVQERRSGWMSTHIARVMFGGRYEYFPAINIMNNGCISNLNDNCIVEVPGVIGPDCVKGLNMGPLPEELLPYCALHASQSNLIADAIVHGDRDIALKAMLMDPFIQSITKAEEMVDAFIEQNRPYDITFK